MRRPITERLTATASYEEIVARYRTLAFTRWRADEGAIVAVACELANAVRDAERKSAMLDEITALRGKDHERA